MSTEPKQQLPTVRYVECTQPVGEYPDVPVTFAAAAAFDALDSLCQELEAVKAANAQLLEENAQLRIVVSADHEARLRMMAERDAARRERDTANALNASHGRRGW